MKDHESKNKARKMAWSRRQFINISSASLGGILIPGTNSGLFPDLNFSPGGNYPDLPENEISLIGLYGPWAASLMKGNLPSLSFRRKEWSRLDKWCEAAKKRLAERLAIPDIGGLPDVKPGKQYSYDGLQIEELSWQLPYGRPTEAILLKPLNANGPLPGILAFHDHGANKYFGTRKITRTSDNRHPLIVEHQHEYYGDNAWANEIAKRGYVVLVSDAFPFASRRVLLQDVPPQMRQKLNDNDPENPENIKAYNRWAADHEHTMAKSLFSAGTTWPGVFFAEDRKALDVLCSRKDVDATRIGCGGLSGGGNAGQYSWPVRTRGSSALFVSVL